MKILLTMNLPYYPAFNGASKANRVVMESLVTRGHEVRALVPAVNTQSQQSPDALAADLEGEGLAVHRLNGSLHYAVDGVDIEAVKDPANIRGALSKAIEAFEPDWVLASCEDPSYTLLETALDANCKTGLLLHTVQYLPFGPQAFYPSQRGAELLPRLSAIFAVSEFASAYIEQHAGLKASVFHMPVYGDAPFPKLARPEEGYVTLVNPCAAKGIDIFLEMAHRMPDVAFAAVPTWGATEADRAALAASPNVTVLAPQSDFDCILEQTRVLLMPSLWQETFGQTVVEAMLRGIPVLASDVGGHREAKLGTDYVIPVRPIKRFTDEFDGNAIPVPELPEQDAGPWCEALRSILSNRERYSEQSKRARDASAAFVKRIGVQNLEALLRDPQAPATNGTAKRKTTSSTSTAERLAKLSPKQRALLMKKLQEKKASGSTASESDSEGVSAIVPVPREDGMVLSFGQERLWFLYQLDPTNPSYNMPAAVQMNGALDVDALAWVFNALQERHESLRTRFRSQPGSASPEVVVHNDPVPFSVEDYRELPVAEQEVHVTRLTSEEALGPFDLQRDVLLRVRVLRLADDRHSLLVTVHHIICDGWSIGVMLREIAALYEARVAGRATPLSPMSLQYADFAHWQRDFMSGDELGEQVDYWREHLNDAPAELTLPTDASEPGVAPYAGALVEHVLSSDLTAAVQRLCKSQEVTLFMVLLGAYNVLLQRLSDQRDVVVGTPIAGRARRETEGLIGLFVNMLAIRTRVDDEVTFKELLAQVRDSALGAFAHQDLPFEKLVEALKPERDLRRHPICQVVLNVTNTPEPPVTFSGLTLQRQVTDEMASKMLATLYAHEEEGCVHLKLVYQRARFSMERMTDFLRQFELILEQVTRLPESRVGELSLVTSHAQRVLPDMAEMLEQPEQLPLPYLVQKMAFENPDSVAVTCGEASWTYRELWARADQLAHRLVADGVKPGDAVAVEGPRSFGLIVALVAVPLAGGVMVPFDSSLPESRRDVMRGEADVKHTVDIQVGRSTRRPENTAIAVDGASGRSTAIPAAKVDLPRLSDRDPVCIFFTSGTTGVPKAVVGAHRGISHFLTWQRDTFGVTPQDRVAQLTSLSFEVVMRDIFLPLTTGATLCLPGEERCQTPDDVIPWLNANSISILHAVPSLARRWLVAQSDGELPHLRYTFFAGEPLTDATVAAWRGAARRARIVNFYSPTEVSMAKCYHEVEGDPVPGVQPVGRTIPDAQALVLAASGRACGIGEAGEIVFRSPFSAIGYLAPGPREAARFISNPALPTDSAGPLYRTGDGGRFLPDGRLEILGRTDDQVKIRGVRIETAEVSRALMEHPAIKDAATVAGLGPDEEKMLVAYVVPENGSLPDAATLQSHVAKLLPPAMVPAVVTALDAIPVTVNGKLDHGALPLPNVRAAEDKEPAAPRYGLEIVLTNIWEEAFGRSPIGVTDNFFEIGGHSLLAAHIMARVSEHLNQEVHLATLFEHPTIESLATAVADGLRDDGMSPLIPLQPKGTRPPFFCVHPAPGTVFCYIPLAEYLGDDQPFYAFQAPGLYDEQPALEDNDTIARTYVEAMRTVQPKGPYHLGGHSAGAGVAYAMAQQLQDEGEEVALLAVLDQGPPSMHPGETTFQSLCVENADDALFLTSVAKVIENYFDVDLGITCKALKGLSTDEKYALCIVRLQEHHVFPADAGPETMRGLIDVLRNGMSANWRYVAQPYSGQVALFRSTEFFSQYPLDAFSVLWKTVLSQCTQHPGTFLAFVSHSFRKALTEVWGRYVRRDTASDFGSGWSRLAPNVEAYRVPGNHISMLREPYVKHLAARLGDCLERARRG
jgi:amino acid adenylation domain-containing protein